MARMLANMESNYKCICIEHGIRNFYSEVGKCRVFIAPGAVYRTFRITLKADSLPNYERKTNVFWSMCVFGPEEDKGIFHLKDIRVKISKTVK